MKIFGIVGVLLLMVWYVPTLVRGVKITEAMNREMQGEDVEYVSLLDGPAPLAWWRNRTEVAETFSRMN